MSLTVSLIAVLIPLLFMSDVVGRLFREFAITLAVTILVSAVRLADADAHDVLAHSAGQGGRQTDPLLLLVGERSSTPSSPSMGARCRWFCAIASSR
jgi:hypothetical protein